LRVSENGKLHGNRKIVTDDGNIVAIACVTYPRDTTTGNARLLAAAYNAFDSAAKRLGCNAVELAESMQDGGIAALVETLNLFEQSRTAFEHGNDEESERLYAQAAERNRVVLAKVNGGAHS